MYRTKHLFLFLCILLAVSIVGGFLYIIPYGSGSGKNQTATDVVFAVPQERYALYTKPENASAGARTAFISKVRDSLDYDTPKRVSPESEIVVEDDPVQLFETTPVVVAPEPVVLPEVVPPVVVEPVEVYEVTPTSTSVMTHSSSTVMETDSATTTPEVLE